METVDPSDVVTAEDYTARLRALHQAAGAPSLRTLEKWADRQRAGGRLKMALPHSTVADILAGKRLPSSSFVDCFVEACGVTGDAKKAWLAKRAELTGRTLKQDSPKRKPRRFRSRRTYIATAIAAAAILAAALASLSARIAGQRPLATIGCNPSSCQTVEPRLTVHGRLTGRRPDGTGAYLLTRVESTHRWYLGAEVTPTTQGGWDGEIGVGNPEPQPHDRDFTVCLYLLPDNAIAKVTDKQITYAGAGLFDADLPPARKQLACIAARRLAQPR